jgi:polysaccharide chain length determinant protein (PEP-CTERM system associated)
MRELVEQVLTEIRGSWRFRHVAMVTAWLVCLVGWAVVFAIPDTYEARARFYVDARSRLAEVMSDVGVAQTMGSQVFVVQQAMVEQPQLEKVAKETGLALRASTPEEHEALIRSLKEQVQISTGRANEARDLYTITFRDRDREMSVKVVESLLRAFVNDVLNLKERDGADVEGYLDEQLAHYARLLSEAEAKLAAFKKEHVGLLPGDNGGIFERLQREMNTLSTLQLELRTEQDRNLELRRQLQNLDPYAAAAATGVKPTIVTQSPTEAAIDELERTRTELLLRYTDRHPDVIAANEQLERLYEKREQERLAAAAASQTGGVATSTNPVYQTAQIALNESAVRIAALEGQVAHQKGVVAELKEQVNTIPEIEAQYTELSRNYDQYRELYAEIMLKRERERMGNAGEERDVVNFNIIDPPSAPLEPVAPPRSLLLAAVLLAGLAAGGGMAFLLHQLNPVFQDVKSLTRVFNRPVLGAVSLMWTDQQRAQRRARVAAFAAACAGLVVAFGLAVVFQDEGIQAVKALTSETVATAATTAETVAQGEVSQ